MFGDRLRMMRLQRRMTQEALAREMKSTKQVISRYENGVRTPNIEIGRRFAAYFNVSLDYLMGAVDDPGGAPRKQMPPIPGVARGVSDQDAPDAASALGIRNIVPIQKRRIPLLGEIAAGVPIFAEEQHDLYVTAEDDLRCDFALKVKGDSMINANIHDGDIVFIKAQPDVLDGQIAAVVIDDEATLKRVYHVKGGVTLVAENPKYAPMSIYEADAFNVRILGLAVSLHHRIV